MNKALEILGYQSLFVITYDQLEENLSKYDAFTHTPLAAIYRDLDRRFPDSRFILNIRERESWLRSLERQWKIADSTGISEAGREIRRRVYGAEQFDRDILGRVYDQHLDDVSHHFKGRKQSLLILNVCGGEGFDKLCPFLGKPVPSQPFPHQNSALKTFERPSQKIKRLMIRYLKARKIKRFLRGLLRR